MSILYGINVTRVFRRGKKLERTSKPPSPRIARRGRWPARAQRGKSGSEGVAAGTDGINHVGRIRKISPVCHPERRAKPEVEGSSHRFEYQCFVSAKILRLASLAQNDKLGTVGQFTFRQSPGRMYEFAVLTRRFPRRFAPRNDMTGRRGHAPALQGMSGYPKILNSFSTRR